MHVCLIDDDPRLLDTIQRGFVELGHDCEAFASAPEGLDWLLAAGEDAPDVLLLDVMMPEMTGWELLAKLREGGLSTPTIFLTARQEVDDRIHGLELGADDYVIKPFAFRELLARIGAVLRRHGFSEPLRVGRLTIFRDRHRVERDGQIIETSPKEHALLVLLASEPGRIFSRVELLREVWEIEFDPGTNLVDVLVARLRRKLGSECGRVIETVIREGYRIRTEALD